MIYSVDFKKMAGKVNPFAFCKYLTQTGWKKFNTKRKEIQVYQKRISQHLFQITMPIDKQLFDYCDAMYAAVQTLASVENKSIESVLLYLLNPNTDILKIRLEREGVEAGNILLDDAINLYDNAKKLLAATTMDVINPKLIHYGRIDDSVQNFLSDCRFGQTEIGSYIVSIVCPFAEISDAHNYRQLSIFSDEEQCSKSLTRKVTNKVMKNICYIKEHIDSDDCKSLYQPENQEDLISANFYEALNGLNADDSCVEFMAEWSPVVKNSTSTCNSVSLSHDYCSPISEVINKLKDYEEKATCIVGRIKSLDSTPAVDTRTKGKITVVYIDDCSNKKTVTTELEISDYDQAIHAHENGKYVRLIGKIIQSRHPSMKCDSFSVID